MKSNFEVVTVLLFFLLCFIILLDFTLGPLHFFPSSASEENKVDYGKQRPILHKRECVKSFENSACLSENMDRFAGNAGKNAEKGGKHFQKIKCPKIVAKTCFNEFKKRQVAPILIMIGEWSNGCGL